ncbi:MAG: aminopeptidase P N-terminal domain-containing protein [Gammaproteobacteria bacterium]|nr:aminopeptidase P N-terminal domain-containing protein [Gammaproteobacteria bacterium]
MHNLEHIREYSRRRQRFMASIGPGSVALIFATGEKRRNADVEYLFRPHSDFVYLTGFHEPDGLLVLAPSHPTMEEVLFVRARDVAAEQWNGRRLGAERVRETLGIENGFTIEEYSDVIPSLLDGRDALHADQDVETSHQVEVWLNSMKESGLAPPEERVELEDTLHELRLIKSDAEIETMQKAADISAAAHQRAMRYCKPGISELALESELQHEFALRGARFTAYPSIVASGPNGCIMHYIQNDRTIEDGDLILIDAGCEYRYYASDITRTFPANGRFTPQQREIYELVLSAQLAAIDQVKTGHLFTDPHDTSTRVLAQGLLDLGILKGSLDEVLEQELAKPFTVHRCSHFLGLDVHDVGKREIDGEARALEPGMVLTVEPGLYFGNAETMPDLDPSLHDIGIRIEDDVVVTENGNRVLSVDLPKSADDVEALMAG